MEQMIVCNVKGDDRSDETHRELSPNSAVHLSFTEHFSVF